MPRPLAPLTVFASFAATAACAAVEEQPAAPVAGLSAERQCFFARQINGYAEAPDGPRGERLYVDTGPNDRWLFETFAACPELDWAQAIALDTRALSSMCTGNTATLIVPTSGRTPDRCSVTLLGKMAETR